MNGKKIITPEQAIELDEFCATIGFSEYDFKRVNIGNFAIFNKGKKAKITSWSERDILGDTACVYYLNKNSNTVEY